MHRNKVPHTFHCAFWQNVMKCVYCPPDVNSEPLRQRLCFLSPSCPAWDTSSGISTLAFLLHQRPYCCFRCCCCCQCCCCYVSSLCRGACAKHRLHTGWLLWEPGDKEHMWWMSSERLAASPGMISWNCSASSVAQSKITSEALALFDYFWRAESLFCKNEFSHVTQL